jgi:exonuclease III
VSAQVPLIFRDRWRPLLAAAAAGWLLFMGNRYAHFASEAQPGYEGCVAAPASCEGHDIYMALWTVTEVGEGGYTVRKVSGPVPVVGPSEALVVGDRVSVVGTYDPEGQQVIELQREVHRWRWLKELLSVVGLLAVAVMIPLVYTWRGGVVSRG